MDKRWLNLFFGQVRIEVTGRRAEQFINRCLEKRVSISNITRTSETSIECTVPSTEVRAIRPVLRSSDCKLHIIGRKGLPFFIQHLSLKKGFVAGMILFAAVLFVLSNMLWSVDIEGADPKTEHQIKQVLNELGVKPGKFQFSLPDKENLQHEIAARVDKVAWVSLNLEGTTYEFDVVEKELPKKEKALTPRNLVSDKEAMIYDIYVEQGQAAVEPDDYVQKGDVLISGTIGDEKRNKRVAAKGKVWGETWYESNITIPLVTELKTRTGESYEKLSIELFGFRVPIWGFSKPEFEHYDVKTKETPIKFLRWELPVTFISKNYLQTETDKRTYTKEQALEKAKQLGRKDLRNKLGPHDKIKSEKVLRETVENGKVKVLMYYTVIENIAVEQPLIDNKETE